MHFKHILHVFVVGTSTVCDTKTRLFFIRCCCVFRTRFYTSVAMWDTTTLLFLIFLHSLNCSLIFLLFTICHDFLIHIFQKQHDTMCQNRSWQCKATKVTQLYKNLSFFSTVCIKIHGIKINRRISLKNRLILGIN